MKTAEAVLGNLAGLLKRRQCECQGARERFDDCEGKRQLFY